MCIRDSAANAAAEAAESLESAADGDDAAADDAALAAALREEWKDRAPAKWAALRDDFATFRARYARHVAAADACLPPTPLGEASRIQFSIMSKCMLRSYASTPSRTLHSPSAVPKRSRIIGPPRDAATRRPGMAASTRSSAC